MIRVAAVAVAVTISGWFVLGLVQARSGEQAAVILAPFTRASSPRLDRADALLDRAGTLNPDRSVDLLRARLALAHADTAAAVTLLRDVVRDEPDNALAWAQLSLTTARSDPVASRRAAAQVRGLVPAVPAP